MVFTSAPVKLKCFKPKAYTKSVFILLILQSATDSAFKYKNAVVIHNNVCCTTISVSSYIY